MHGLIENDIIAMKTLLTNMDTLNDELKKSKSNARLANEAYDSEREETTRQGKDIGNMVQAIKDQRAIVTTKDAEIASWKENDEALEAILAEIEKICDESGAQMEGLDTHIEKVENLRAAYRLADGAFKEVSKKLESSGELVLKVKASAANDRARLRKFRQLVTDNMKDVSKAFKIYNKWIIEQDKAQAKKLKASRGK